jgi:hypothetical protein
VTFQHRATPETGPAPTFTTFSVRGVAARSDPHLPHAPTHARV